MRDALAVPCGERSRRHLVPSWSTVRSPEHVLPIESLHVLGGEVSDLGNESDVVGS